MTTHQTQHPPSTDVSAALPHVAELDAFSEPMIAELAKQVGLDSSSPRKAVLAAIRASRSDREKVRKELAGESATGLIAIELMAARGGAWGQSDLEKELVAFTGLPRELVRYAVARLEHLLLSVRLSRAPDRPGTQALLAPGAAIVASLLEGATAPAIPSDLVVPHPAELRDRVALCAATLHVDLRVTQTSAVHRGSCKTYAKVLGCDADVLARTLDGLIERGLMSMSSGILRPDPRRVAQACASGMPPSRVYAYEERAYAWLDRPVEASHLERVIAHGGGSVDSVRLRLANAWSVVSISHGGSRYYARAGTSREARTGDGHVTPSLEVMLGPAAHPDVVRVVALGAELVRLDHVLTFRITPDSVARAIAEGLAVDELISTLAVVGPRGIAPNVESNVRSFASRVRRVRVLEGVTWVVEAKDAHRNVTWPEGTEEIAPGVLFRAGGAAVADEVRGVLRQAGFAVPQVRDHGRRAPGPPSTHPDAGRPPEVPPPPWALRPGPDVDAVLQRKIRAAMADGFRAERSWLDRAMREYLDARRAAEEPPTHLPPPRQPMGSRAPRFTLPSPASIAQLAARYDDTVSALSAWHRRLSAKHQRRVPLPDVLADPMVVLLLAALPSELAGDALRDSRSFRELVNVIGEVLEDGFFPPESAPIVRWMVEHDEGAASELLRRVMSMRAEVPAKRPVADPPAAAPVADEPEMTPFASDAHRREVLAALIGSEKIVTVRVRIGRNTLVVRGVRFESIREVGRDTRVLAYSEVDAAGYSWRLGELDAIAPS